MLNAKVEAEPFARTEIRPGVMFPDWAVIRSARAREALVAILGAFRADECWRGYSADEDVVRSSIIRHYAAASCAPSPSDLAAATRLPQDALHRLLRQLRDRDLIVMDGELIVGAYPLTSRKTEHQVHMGGKTVHAMCAIDALAVGAMLGRDIEVASACRQCGAAITVVTRGTGTALATVAPAGALVWSGMRTDAGCAADTLCTVIAFFCSAAHLEVWRARNHPHIAGYRLPLDEALQVGRAIFGPTLAGLGNSAVNDRRTPMNDKRLIWTGGIGAAIAAICCATPALALVLPLVGLGAWLAAADYVLVPLLLACLGLVGLGLYRSRRQREHRVP